MLKRGVVRSASFDCISKAIVYQIGYGIEGGVTEDVPENQLGYGANCPY